MDSATSDILFSSCLGGVLFVIGLVLLWLGYTTFGRIAPHPRAFWGMAGGGFMFAGVGVFLMGTASGETPPPAGDVPATLAHLVSFYVFMLGLLVAAMWGAWAYLLQYLYTSKEVVIAGKMEIEHERTGRLRRRNLAVASTGVGGIVGYVAASTLVSFSRTAPQGDLAPIAAAFGVGCVVGGIAFGVAFLVLRIWFRRELITE